MGRTICQWPLRDVAGSLEHDGNAAVVATKRWARDERREGQGGQNKAVPLQAAISIYIHRYMVREEQEHRRHSLLVAALAAACVAQEGWH